MTRLRVLVPLLLAILTGVPRRAFADCVLTRVAELPVTMQTGRPLVTAQINGTDVQLIAESGAFYSLLTQASARRFGLSVRPIPKGATFSGVGGEAGDTMTSTRRFALLGHAFPSVDFLVGGDNILTGDVAGLLGDNFLTENDSEFDLAKGVIRLFRTGDCHHRTLAYWVKTPTSIGEVALDRSAPHHLIGSAKVNGHVIRVMFDTGARTSILKLNAAARAGLTPGMPGAVAGGAGGGLGRRRSETWIVPVADFEIGGEEIKATRLRIGDMELDDADMLLGADFFLAHHIYASKATGRLYFTYNGGAVFDLRVKRANRVEDPPRTPAPLPDADEPKDAASLSRLAAAELGRRDDSSALAHLDRALALEPTSAAYLTQRAQAHFGLEQVAEGEADLERALKLKPADEPALMMRGVRRLRAGNLAGAKADFDAAEAVGVLDADLGLRIAALYGDADQFELAIAEDDKWIKGHPDDDRMPDALDGRCWTYVLWNRELDRARADCDRAVRLSRGDHSSLDSRGLLRLRLGQYDAAIRDYDAALRLQPRSAWSHYGRGLAELRTGRTTAGQADLAAAQALAPKLAERAASLGLAP